MNRRRFLKLFGAAAAAGAVPAVKGASAAIAYAEKEPVQVESAFQRLVDAMGGLRQTFIDCGDQTRAAARAALEFEEAMSNVRALDGLDIGKMEEAIRLMAETTRVDLTPNFVIMSPEQARELERLHGIKVEERRQEMEGFLLDRISRPTGLSVDVLTSPYCPRDQAFVLPRTASLLDPLSRPAKIVGIDPALPGGDCTVYAPAVHEFGRRRS